MKEKYYLDNLRVNLALLIFLAGSIYFIVALTADYFFFAGVENKNTENFQGILLVLETDLFTIIAYLVSLTFLVANSIEFFKQNLKQQKIVRQYLFYALIILSISGCVIGFLYIKHGPLTELLNFVLVKDYHSPVSSMEIRLSASSLPTWAQINFEFARRFAAPYCMLEFFFGDIIQRFRGILGLLITAILVFFVIYTADRAIAVMYFGMALASLLFLNGFKSIGNKYFMLSLTGLILSIVVIKHYQYGTYWSVETMQVVEWDKKVIGEKEIFINWIRDANGGPAKSYTKDQTDKDKPNDLMIRKNEDSAIASSYLPLGCLYGLSSLPQLSVSTNPIVSLSSTLELADSINEPMTVNDASQHWQLCPFNFLSMSLVDKQSILSMPEFTPLVSGVTKSIIETVSNRFLLSQKIVSTTHEAMKYTLPDSVFNKSLTSEIDYNSSILKDLPKESMRDRIFVSFKKYVQFAWSSVFERMFVSPIQMFKYSLKSYNDKNYLHWQSTRVLSFFGIGRYVDPLEVGTQRYHDAFPVTVFGDLWRNGGFSYVPCYSIFLGFILALLDWLIYRPRLFIALRVMPIFGILLIFYANVFSATILLLIFGSLSVLFITTILDLKKIIFCRAS